MELSQEMVGITAAKNELPRRVKKLTSGELERVVIVKQNSPVAVIVSVAEYDRMKKMEDLSEELEDLIAVLEAKQKDNGVRISLDEVKAKYGLG